MYSDNRPPGVSAGESSLKENVASAGLIVMALPLFESAGEPLI